MNQGIYKITNNINQKVYIGQSIDIDGRWKTHIGELINNSHHSPELQNDFDTYGLDVFQFEILEIINDKNLLSICERYYIDKFDSIRNGYNTAIPSRGFNISKTEDLEINNNIVIPDFIKIDKGILQDVTDGNCPIEFLESYKDLIDLLTLIHNSFEDFDCEISYMRYKDKYKKLKISVTIQYYDDFVIKYVLRKDNSLGFKGFCTHHFDSLSQCEKILTNKRKINLSTTNKFWI